MVVVRRDEIFNNILGSWTEKRFTPRGILARMHAREEAAQVVQRLLLEVPFGRKTSFSRIDTNDVEKMTTLFGELKRPVQPITLNEGQLKELAGYLVEHSVLTGKGSQISQPFRQIPEMLAAILVLPGHPDVTRSIIEEMTDISLRSFDRFFLPLIAKRAEGRSATAAVAITTITQHESDSNFAIQTLKKLLQNPSSDAYVRTQVSTALDRIRRATTPRRVGGTKSLKPDSYNN